ncbi:MAG TPA: response regulator [Burkholderiales bacterium]|nr:response regulator [Burkholderiales bacterium]
MTNNVLVIDDNEDVRTLIQLALEAEGFHVAVAANGHEGMGLLREKMAEVVVTDILMPEQDGIETIAELRRDFPDVKIIAISGALSATGFDYLRVPIQLGVARILRKPFDIQELVGAIRELVLTMDKPDSSKQ